MKRYDSWEECAFDPENKSKKAIVQGMYNVNGKMVPVDIVKGQTGDAVIYARDTGVEIQRTGAKVIDRLRGWRKYN